ncbi:hypothetical protein HDV00_005738 [Rhizophlyctis rosea]|nr:hypothetical protein HDV00_005738 [Rhizophlyctis rosea]
MADFIDDESILHFCEITGAAPDVAKTYLQVSEGNVEAAITLFMESGGAPLTSEQSTRPTTSASNGSSDSSGSFGVEGVRAPIAPKRSVLVGGDDDEHDHGGPVYYAPPPRRTAGPSAAAPLPVDPFRNYEQESQFVRNLRAAGREPGGDPERADRLANLFRPPLEIMFQGDFEKAKASAREKSKWLMVTIHRADEFQSQMMNRDLFSKQEVKDVIKENFIFVLWGSESNEGQMHAVRYPFQQYPYLAIIDPLTGERVKQWNTVPSVTDFIVEVTDFLDGRIDAKPPSKKKKTKARRTVTEMSEDEQLQMALAASMGSNEPIVINDDDVAPEAMAEDDFVKTAPQKPEEVWAYIQPVKRPEPTSDAARIQFRLPDGSRIVHKFGKTDPIRHLFEFVKSEVPQAKERPFDLIDIRNPLLVKIDESITDAGLGAAASLSVVFSD